jgi:hypothetical protein
MSFKELSEDVSVSCYCSLVSPEMLLAVNGFLTHSSTEILTYFKSNENCFCKAPKQLMKSFLLASVSLLGCLSKVGNLLR